ncbi:MAG: DUF1904 family protein [Veillonella sp.]|uniref:DUF1904 family protein n=1 Tax=Veillonella sp. TaxID=1926307 RepID=UPI0025FF4745|nr:DUF1904 family protein [Veillonella sp.]MBS4913202.1 DUF1904 family protein [Veillonella sp.]
MPQLIFKGVKPDVVKKLSIHLPKTLSDLSNTPLDYFTLECPETQYFRNGEVHNMYPLVEVLQFDRGVEMEGQMAKCIADAVKAEGFDVCEVYFMHIGRDDYYEF